MISKDISIKDDTNWYTLLDLVYPVGSIYCSTKSTSPASLMGGTWSAISGKFLLGTNSTYTLGSTGGEATHTLTTNEMPTHKHTVNLVGDSSDWLGGSATTHVVKSDTSTVSTNNTGGGQGAQQHATIPSSFYLGKNRLTSSMRKEGVRR